MLLCCGENYRQQLEAGRGVSYVPCMGFAGNDDNGSGGDGLCDDCAGGDIYDGIDRQDAGAGTDA